MKDIEVTIFCITYNQSEYIATAIESFLMQKTNFNYKILIHDDASTDGTTEILKQYEKKYPDIVKVVYQTENQYSKRIKIMKAFMLPLLEGKYIASCEGDDYWTDEYKLQKQYDYMESNPGCSMCVHSSLSVKADTGACLCKNILSKNFKTYDIVDAINGLGRDVATNSFFYKRELAYKWPEFREIAPCGDYTLPILAAEIGYIAYIPEIMSAHRILANSSLSKTFAKDYQKRIEYANRYSQMLKCLDEYTEHKYTDIIEKEDLRIWSLCYIKTRNKEKVSQEPYRSYFKCLGIKEKVKWGMALYCPWLLSLIQNSKNIIAEARHKLKRK